ncbi:MAG: hypothetical protein ACTHXA_07340 [Gulosibacter sp.]|uniref:hypothetical protein n=1 Tax=Gulosibacter sp. TaxID=2817531 RepID=UPI003F920EEC
MSITEWPGAAPIYYGWNREPIMRSKRLKRFPYLVLYFVTDVELVIVAFSHTRREPDYWKDRL